MSTDNDETFEDMFDLVCGELLGRGLYRHVYENRLDPDTVIKVENQSYRNFSNVKEFNNWQYFEYHETASRWLAPCKLLSPNGRILIQEKCYPIQPNQLPKTLPSFLTDLKVCNFGITKKGDIVCVDYATVILDINVKMKKVELFND